MSDASDCHSVGSSLSAVDTNSVDSGLSGDARLNDHRHQSMSLPVRTDSRIVQESNNESHGRRMSSGRGSLKARMKIKKMRKNHRSMSTSSNPAVAQPDTTKFTGEGPLPHPVNPLVDSRNLRSKMLATDEEGEEDEYAVKFQDRYAVLEKPQPARQRTRSANEEARILINSPGEKSSGGGILLPPRTSGKNNSVTIMDTPLNRVLSMTSSRSKLSKRRPSKDDSSDSDVDSHGSRESQETEEDVCFPMVPKHVRVRGIDFDEVEEFITEQRLENEQILKREKELRRHSSGEEGVSTSSEKFSSAALKYTPRTQRRSSIGVNDKKEGSSDASNSSGGSVQSWKEGAAADSSASVNSQGSQDSQNSQGSDVPDRFSFFNSDGEATVHGPDFPSLVQPGQSVRSLFEPEDSVWWLDCICPTDDEMKMLAKALGIHPLTAEDIRMQEAREKVEMFRSYYFVCFHTFETDSESEDFLEPINVYIVVFRQGMLTVHFSPISNPANVRRRVRQLRDYVDLSADWLCYAMIDDITDGFAPVIHSIEYEADAIEDSVFLFRTDDFRAMLYRIGESRRKVMTLMRLLQGKADVIKMFAKRCHEDNGHLSGKLSSSASLPAAAAAAASSAGTVPPTASSATATPRADIALYLGDIQDHIITMFQSLLSYEKIFSRSHSNYLAQLQVESFYSNNQVTDMLSKVTMLGTILVPMNLVTGLFGMNVRIPGQDGSNYGWFGGILGFIIIMVIVCGLTANWYMNHVQRRDSSLGGTPSGVSIRSFGFGRRNKPDQQRAPTNRSVASLPSRFTRYGDWS